MATYENRLFKIFVSEDLMTATFSICPENPDEEYTLQDAMNFLLASNIRMGVNKEKLEEVIREKKLRSPFVVASGKPCVNGVDGSYEFLFDTNPGAHPLEEEDGSVDYLNTSMFTEVKAGDKIAVYTPATVGEFGFNVEGKLLQPVKGKNLQPLHGKGVERAEDEVTYYAGITGKIEYKYGEISISEVYDFIGNLNMSASNIRFSGDVHVHGDVASGMIIDALGSVEIDGHVAGAMIKAGKDVLLKRGVQGCGRAKIEAGGNVMGQFFEEALVSCKGDIEANYLLNCYVNAGNHVKVHGKKGLIIGGHVHGTGAVIAASAGNENELITEISAGAENKIHKQYSDTAKELQVLENDLAVLENGIDQMTHLRRENPSAYNPVIMSKMLQAKIVKGTQKQKDEESLEYLLELMKRSEDAYVGIHGIAYPGVKIRMGSAVKRLATKYSNTRFFLADQEIQIASLD